MLVAALLVAGLASFRLYQKYLGEQNLRKLTTADRAAIDLAVEFGCERQMAREILRSAIQIAIKNRDIDGDEIVVQPVFKYYLCLKVLTI